MPWGLKRFQQSGQTHFVTFCCHHRRPSFTEASAKITFENALERVRLSFSAYIYGYVVMPEHVHLLISEPPQATLAEAMKSLKQGVARRLIAGADHFWHGPPARFIPKSRVRGRKLAKTAG
jgi:putative transposase